MQNLLFPSEEILKTSAENAAVILLTGLIENRLLRSNLPRGTVHRGTCLSEIETAADLTRRIRRIFKNWDVYSVDAVIACHEHPRDYQTK